MNIWIVLLVTFFAGMGAGLGTGFAGMSAAAVITPMLVTFLDVNPYTAVGIALASDVLASGVSAFTYHKNKNLDIKNGLLMMAMVLLFTVVGSYVSSVVPAQTMGGFSTFMTLILGIKFIVKPVMTTKQQMEAVSKKRKIAGSILCGTFIVVLKYYNARNIGHKVKVVWIAIRKDTGNLMSLASQYLCPGQRRANSIAIGVGMRKNYYRLRRGK